MIGQDGRDREARIGRQVLRYDRPADHRGVADERAGSGVAGAAADFALRPADVGTQQQLSATADDLCDGGEVDVQRASDRRDGLVHDRLQVRLSEGRDAEGRDRCLLVGPRLVLGLGALAVADAAVVDRQPAVGRIRVRLDPFVAALEAGLELHVVALAHRLVVAVVERGADHGGEELPHPPPEDVLTLQHGSQLRSHEPERQVVDVRVAPLPVDGDKRVGDALEDRLDPSLRRSRLLLRALALGHVAVDAEVPDDLAATVADGDRHHVDLDRGAVPAVYGQLGARAIGRQQLALQLLPRAVALVGRHVARVAPEDLRGGVAVQPFGAGVPDVQPEVGVGPDDRVVGALQQAVEGRKPVFAPLVLGDVEHHEHAGDDGAVGSADRRGAAAQDDAGAARSEVDALLVDDPLARAERPDDRELHALVGATVEVREVQAGAQFAGRGHAEHPLAQRARPGVDVDDRSGRIEHRDRRRNLADRVHEAPHLDGRRAAARAHGRLHPHPRRRCPHVPPG